MDMKKIEKARPVIAAVVILSILGFWLVPKLFKGDKGITASGTVEVREVDVASRISSRVASLNVEEGASVAKGQLLAVLDDSIVSAQRDAAAAMYKNSADIYNRSKNMFETSSISQQQFDLSRTNYISASSQLKQAEVMTEEALLKAPWDGVILKKYVEVGELVSPNSPLFTLGDLGIAKVTIYVPLKEMEVINYGDEVKVSIDALDKKVFTGKVTFISSQAEFTPKNVQTKDERIKEVFQVEVTVPNPEHILKPGIPADVEIITNSKSQIPNKK